MDGRARSTQERAEAIWSVSGLLASSQDLGFGDPRTAGGAIASGGAIDRPDRPDLHVAVRDPSPAPVPLPWQGTHLARRRPPARWRSFEEPRSQPATCAPSCPVASTMATLTGAASSRSACVMVDPEVHRVRVAGPAPSVPTTSARSVREMATGPGCFVHSQGDSDPRTRAAPVAAAPRFSTAKRARSSGRLERPSLAPH